jgi:hypothetical protein
VVFPRVVDGREPLPPHSASVLVETFEAGTPLMEWVAQPHVTAEAKKVSESPNPSKYGDADMARGC